MWTNEPSEYFQEYPIDINRILFDTWDEIFGDVEEYYATCHGWTIFLDENGWKIKWMNFQMNVGNKIIFAKNSTKEIE